MCLILFSVYLNMATYVHLSPDTEVGQPVVLGIKDTDFYLTVHKTGDKPTLHLEVNFPR